MAGPAARPAKLKLLEGRAPGRDSGGRPVNPGPGFKREVPQKPALSPVASAKWDEVIGEMARVELLTPLHGAALQMLCETYAEWRAARDVVDAEGISSTNSQGRVRHYAVVVAAEAEKRYMAWCARFGLTPSDEQNVGTDGGDGGDVNPFAGGA